MGGIWGVNIYRGGIWGQLSELNMGHNEWDVPLYMELKGLQMYNELREGGDIDTTENLEVHKGFTLESMELITYFRFVAGPTGSVLSGDIKMPTELNIEKMVGAAKVQEGWAEVIRTCIEIWGGSKWGLKKAVGTELRGVGGNGKVLEPLAAVLGSDLRGKIGWVRILDLEVV